MSLGSQFTSVGTNILTSKMRGFQQILSPLLVTGKFHILHWPWMCSGNGSTHGPSLGLSHGYHKPWEVGKWQC